MGGPARRLPATLLPAWSALSALLAKTAATILETAARRHVDARRCEPLRANIDGHEGRNSRCALLPLRLGGRPGLLPAGAGQPLSPLPRHAVDPVLRHHEYPGMGMQLLPIRA